MAKPKMRRIRGEYRPFFEALFTGKDFCRLSPDAKLAYMFVKGLSGAAGIKVWPAFIEQLAELTGMPAPRMKRAISDLSDANWLQVEGSVVWVVRGLDFEPQMVAANEKHRAWLKEHIDSLPRVSLLERFRAENSAWFSAEATSVSDRESPTVSDGVSDRVSDTHADTLSDTNPYPISQSPSQSLSLSPSQAGTPVDPANGEHRRRLAIAANKGITALLGREHVRPIRWDLRSTHEAAEILAASAVDIGFAERAVYQLAKAKLPADGLPVESLKYFAQGIVRAWHAELAHRDAAVAPTPAPADGVVAGEVTFASIFAEIDAESERLKAVARG